MSAAALPHDPEAESAALGAVLAEADRVMPMLMDIHLHPADFYEAQHRKIYAAMLNMRDAGTPIDCVTVSRETGLTITELDLIMQTCPTWTHGQHYGEKVIEASRLCRWAELSASISEQVQDGKVSAEILADLRAQMDWFDHATGTLAAVSAAAWAQEILPAPDQVLGSAFDLGTKAVLVAPSKARKSFFMLQLAVSLTAAKKSFLSWEIPKPRRVCFWNLEITPPHFHARLLRMLQALDLTPPALADRLFIVNSRGIEAGLAQISGIIKSHGVEVVFIDPIYKLLPGDESDQEAVKFLLRGMDKLCTETGAAIVYSHHCGKGNSGDRLTIDRASGSGVMARDFDCMISLVPHVDDGLLVVEQIARSYPPRDPFCIGWDNDRGCFDVLDGVDPVVQTSKNRNKSGRVGPALTDDDALAVVSAKPLPSEMFRGELQRRGFTDHGAREVKARLIETGKLEVMKTRTFPHKVYVGTPEGIDRLRQEYQNPKIEGLK